MLCFIPFSQSLERGLQPAPLIRQSQVWFCWGFGFVLCLGCGGNLGNHLVTEILLECFGDGDGAVGVLVLLEERDNEAWEGGAGTVKGVAEVVFTVGVFVAELHAAGLVVAEV